MVPETSAALLAGLDIGGTKLGWSLGTAEGTVLASERCPTDHGAAPEMLLERAVAGLWRLAESLDRGAITALGVACPGPFLQPEGRFLEPPNLPRWQGFALTEFLAERVSVPFRAMNDANAGVLAEWTWGAAQGADTAVFLTMSTGMGAGLIIGGRLFEGPLGFAGEVGHLRLAADGPVGFGKRGSVEGYLSGPGLVQVARGEALRSVQLGRDTELEDSDALTPERICDLARSGDPAAVAAIDISGRRLGELCALLTDLLNPDVIVLGTIGTAFPDLFLPRVRTVLDEEAIPRSAAHVDVRTSGLEQRGEQSALAIAHSVTRES